MSKEKQKAEVKEVAMPVVKITVNPDEGGHYIAEIYGKQFDCSAVKEFIAFGKKYIVTKGSAVKTKVEVKDEPTEEEPVNVDVADKAEQ